MSRPRGRPPRTGPRPLVVTFRCDAETVARIDEAAQLLAAPGVQVGRSDAIRALVLRGLDAMAPTSPASPGARTSPAAAAAAPAATKPTR